MDAKTNYPIMAWQTGMTGEGFAIVEGEDKVAVAADKSAIRTFSTDMETPVQKTIVRPIEYAGLRSIPRAVGGSCHRRQA